MSYYNWFVYQFWRFQFVQKEVAKLAETAIEFADCRECRPNHARASRPEGSSTCDFRAAVVLPAPIVRGKRPRTMSRGVAASASR